MGVLSAYDLLVLSNEPGNDWEKLTPEQVVLVVQDLLSDYAALRVRLAEVEAQRNAMKGSLQEIAAIDWRNAATNCAAYVAAHKAREVLAKLEEK